MNSSSFLRNSDGRLFEVSELRSVMDRRFADLKSEVEKLDSNRLLNTPKEELVHYLTERYRFDPVVLMPDQATIDHQEHKLDVSRDPARRFFSDHRNGPLLVDATRFTLQVPFQGDPELFGYRPDKHLLTSFRGEVYEGELRLSHTFEGSDASEVERHFDHELKNITTMLGYSNEMIRQFNEQLPLNALQAIETRKNRLLSVSSMVTNLKFPLRRRQDGPSTYTIPSVQKRIAPVLPPTSKEEFQPEPTIDMTTFEEILRFLRSMSMVMERNPTPFKTLDEEGIRTHFLVSLNSTFEGDATGETFNGKGKTDILLRHKDCNLFIAECKFWKGPKKFTEAVDQLMGYVTWRDTKAALLMFNRGRDTSKVLLSIRSEIAQHSRFKRLGIASGHEDLRVILGQERDTNREVIVAIQVFDVPGPD